MSTSNILGKYEIISEVGRGGMGVVYKAKDVRLGRIVALKELILLDNISNKDKEEIIERFRREAQTAANLSHLNIVTIYDVGEENKRHFIAMEFLEGKTLKEFLDEGKELTPEEKIDILIQVCDALEHAHSHGVVHRDIKPDNILILKNGKVKITDFGIARMSEALPSMTQDGTMLGTLGYISPEQLHDSRQVDSRADIFSLGAVMYELYTKVLPFDGGSIGATILKIVTENPIPPREINPTIPETIEKIIMKALQKDPDLRYQRASEISSELRTLQERPRAKTFKTFTVSKKICNKCKFVLDKSCKFCPNCGTPVGQEVEAIKETPKSTLEETAKEKNLDSETVGLSFSDRLAQLRNLQKQIKEEELPISHPIRPGRMTSSGYSIDEDESKDSYSEDTEYQIETQSLDPEMKKREEFSSVPSEVLEFYKQFRVVYNRQIGKAGTGKGQFASPRGITISQGLIFVADTGNQRVQVFNKLGEWQFLIQLTDGPEPMRSPCSVAVDTVGRVYVLDSLDSKIRIFDNFGLILESFGEKGKGRGQLSSPSGISISPTTNHIYIADTENHRIQVFDNNGNTIKIFGKYGTRTGEFKTPYGIAVDKDDNVFVIDYGVPRVQMIDKVGIPRLSFGQRGINNGEFSVPRGIAIDIKGRIYVADTLNHRIQIFDSKGEWIYSFGVKGRNEGQFMGPEAIAVSEEGEIFVLDKGNSRIQILVCQNW